MQGELNIFSMYRFMLSVSHIEELDPLLYVLYVCRESFTSPFIHYILCFMRLRFSHLFSYKYMYAGWVNFTSILFMNVYSIYTLLFWFMQKERKILFMSLTFVPLYWWIDKKGREIWSFICMFVLFVTFYHWYQDWYQEHLFLISRACSFH